MTDSPPFPPDFGDNRDGDPLVWDRAEGNCDHPESHNHGGVCGGADCLRTLTVEIDYKVTVQVHASLTRDQARDMFGLGGTSDDDLLRRVEMIAKDLGSVGNLPASLDQHTTDVGTYRREFLNMPGATFLHEIESI